MPPISANVSTSVASRSGDASSGLTTPFQYNGQFTIGTGASASTAAASNSGGAGPGQNNMLLYGAIAAAALAIVIVLARK